MLEKPISLGPEARQSKRRLSLAKRFLFAALVASGVGFSASKMTRVSITTATSVAAAAGATVVIMSRPRRRRARYATMMTSYTR
jgi:hypothetical protein